MERILIFILIFGGFACNQQSGKEQVLQSRVARLEKDHADMYKPGFGEFMIGIQVHHAKLWFAGQNTNWKLADFEIQEILEAVDDIQKYQAGRKESQMIGMLKPALDSVNLAVKKQDPVLFKNSYTLLTNTCNNCHRAADFEFNVVKIPDAQTFSNQDFSVQKPQ